MSDESILFDGISETVRRIARREISPLRLVELALQRIERLNPRLNAYISFGGDARRRAEAAEKAVGRKRRLGPLHGIPVSVKDLIHVQGFSTTAGSKVFGSGLVPERDAEVAARLRQAGAIIVGKCNLHEFAYGVTNENAHYGTARCPWDLSRVSGGSSGGSAGAVAAGLCFASIGTDTRGSIRIPSACCGVTGLKPTLGRVSTDGVIPLSWTLDHVGPITRSVEDAALLLDVMGSSPRRRKTFLAAAAEAPSQLRLGICGYYLEDLPAEIEKPVQAALRILEKLAKEVREIEIPCLDDALHASGVIAASEALAWHERFIKDRSQAYDPAVLERMKKGFRLTAVDLARALKVRQETMAAFDRAFQACDCLIGAVVPSFPHRVGEDPAKDISKALAVVSSMVRLNAPQNVGGVPALTLPCGFSGRLPVGLQLIAARGQESALIQLGASFQRETDWHRRRPQL